MAPVQRAVVKTPDGKFSVTMEMLSKSQGNEIDVELPEGLTAVDVEIYCVGVGNNNKPTGDMVLVKPHERRNTVPMPAPIDLTVPTPTLHDFDADEIDTDLEPSE